nr:hypothetical protein [Tanacetum cinerariifolium]
MVQDNPSKKEPAIGLTNGLSIDDIDANGYLISNVEQDNGSDKPFDVDVSQRWDGEGPSNGNIIGKVFDMPDDAYTFYNQYAFRHGFGIQEFETQWAVLRGKYNLKSSNWMMEMYDQRKCWVWSFLKDGFFAGMTTSGRTVNSRRAAEEDEDFKTMNSREVLSSVHPIEAKAGKCYARKISEKFEKEWKEATNNLTHNTLNKILEHVTYSVGQVNVEKKYWRTVNFSLLNKVDATCSCATFETYGILCKHILYVMKKKHAKTLPDKYILSRWTLDSRYKAGNHSIGIEEINNESGVSALTLWCVHSNSTKAIKQAKDCPSEITRLNTILVKFLEDQISRKKAKEPENVFEDNSVGISQVDMMPQICVRVLLS